MSHGPHPAWWAPDEGWSALLVDGPAFSLGRHRDQVIEQLERRRHIARTWPAWIDRHAERAWRADWSERLRLAIELHAQDIARAAADTWLLKLACGHEGRCIGCPSGIYTRRGAWITCRKCQGQRKIIGAWPAQT